MQRDSCVPSFHVAANSIELLRSSKLKIEECEVVQVVADVVAIQQAISASGLYNTSARTADGPISGTFTNLLAIISQSDSQNLPDQPRTAESEPSLEPTQIPSSRLKPEESALGSGLQLSACACELVMSIAVLGKSLMQHQAMDSSCVGIMYKAIIHSLSHQVRLSCPVLLHTWLFAPACSLC